MANDDLIGILDLEPLEINRYRGRSVDPGWRRVFGGQVIAQALIAAARTVDPARTIHSLHGYFLRPGDPDRAILYEVEVVRDGGSFSTRRVVANQDGDTLFAMMASFHGGEAGFDYQAAMPDMPAPETLSDARLLIAAAGDRIPIEARRPWASPRPIEIRPVDPEAFLGRKGGQSAQAAWIRPRLPLGGDPLMAEAALAYASDLLLLDASLAAAGRWPFEKDLMVSSLDHAMWFHRPFDFADWLLYVCDSPSASSGRGFNRGTIYDRAGRLIASLAQEGLIRHADPARAGVRERRV